MPQPIARSMPQSMPTPLVQLQLLIQLEVSRTMPREVGDAALVAVEADPAGGTRVAAHVPVPAEVVGANARVSVVEAVVVPAVGRVLDPARHADVPAARPPQDGDHPLVHPAVEADGPIHAAMGGRAAVPRHIKLGREPLRATQEE